MTPLYCIDRSGLGGSDGQSGFGNGQNGCAGQSGRHGVPIQTTLWRQNEAGMAVAQVDGNTTSFPVDADLHLVSRGGRGGAGGHGSKGHRGVQGSMGCSDQDGGPGGVGGRGGHGGDAGDGGDGGSIQISVNPLQADLLLTVVTDVSAGPAGAPGRGGPGGDGGPGGNGGFTNTRSTTFNGSQGPPGPRGRDGRRGRDGSHGTVQLHMGPYGTFHTPFRIAVSGFGSTAPTHRYIEPGGLWHSITGVQVANSAVMPLPELECPLQVGLAPCDALHFDTTSYLTVPPLAGNSSAVLPGAMMFQAKSVDADFLRPNEVYRNEVSLPFDLRMPGIRRNTVLQGSGPSGTVTVGYPLQMWVHLGEQVPGHRSHGALLPGKPVALRLRLRNHGGHRMDERSAKVLVRIAPVYPHPHPSCGQPGIMLRPEYGEPVTLSDAVLSQQSLRSFEQKVDVLPKEDGPATDVVYQLEVCTGVQSYVQFRLHVELQLEHATHNDTFVPVQVNEYDLAVVDELSLGEGGDAPHVMLCVTKATPRECIDAYRAQLQAHHLRCGLYDMSLYNGLRCTEQLQAVVARVSPDVHAPADTLAAVMRGGALVMFDDIISSIGDDVDRDGTIVHHVSARSLLVSEEDLLALQGSGLAVVGGQAGPTRQNALRDPLHYPGAQNTLASGRAFARAPSTTASKLGKSAACYVRSQRSSRGAGAVWGFSVPRVKERLSTCCMGGEMPAHGELDKFVKDAAAHLEMEFPDRRFFVGAVHRPEDTAEGGCFLTCSKTFVLGDVLVVVQPKPRVVHRVWDKSSRPEDFSVVETLQPVVFDTVRMLSIELKMHHIKQGTLVDTYARAVVAELVCETNYFFTTNGRQGVESAKESDLFNSFAVINAASLPASIVSTICVPYEALVEVMHSESSYFTRFRSLRKPITEALKSIRKRCCIKEDEHRARVQQVATEFKKKGAAAVCCQLMSPYPDRHRRVQEVTAPTVWVNMTTGKETRIS